MDSPKQTTKPTPQKNPEDEKPKMSWADIADEEEKNCNL